MAKADVNYPRPGLPPEPGPFPERIEFRRSESGADIMIRPRQLIVRPGDRNDLVPSLRRLLVEIVGDERVAGIEQLVDDPVELRDGWVLLRIVDDELLRQLNIMDVFSGLRRKGFEVQPNHVYFVSSLQRNRSSFTPNMFTPNMFTPNMFTPNMFTPNMFTPNMFTPNMFTPNMFTSNISTPCGANSCCCNKEGPVAVPNVPKLAARMVDREPVRLEAATAQRVQVHIIDVVTPVESRDTSFDTGELGEIVPAANPFVPDHNEDRWADPATAHGDFIKSIMELNGCAEVTLWNAADPLGDIDDKCLVDALKKVDLEADHTVPLVLNLSLAGYNEDDQPGELLAGQIREMLGKGWLIVAAAGNSGSCRLAWPAALPGVISVGACGPCGPAWFSNFGPWVDATARGVDVVAEYPSLGHFDLWISEAEEVGSEPIHSSDIAGGWAKWSGTSFAAPLVAARLAQKMQRGRTKDEAILEVIDDPELPRMPYFGTIVE